MEGWLSVTSSKMRDWVIALKFPQLLTCPHPKKSFSSSKAAHKGKWAQIWDFQEITIFLTGKGRNESSVLGSLNQAFHSSSPFKRHFHKIIYPGSDCRLETLLVHKWILPVVALPSNGPVKVPLWASNGTSLVVTASALGNHLLLSPA